MGNRKTILEKPDPAVLRAVGIYLVFGAVWILTSDTVGAFLFRETWTLTAIQSVKGLCFVLATGLVLALLMTRHRTAIRNSQIQLREEHRRLATLLSNLPGMVYRCANDPRWTMEFVSEGCRALTGYEESDLRRNRTVAYADLIHPDDRGGVWRRVQDALDERRPFQIIYRIHAAGEREKWVWEQGRGVFDAEGNVLAIEGFITDVSRLKYADTRRSGAGTQTQTQTQAEAPSDQDRAA